MIRWLWVFLVIWTLMFWQGGFFFYTAVVVPTAQQVIGDLQQGFITRRVTMVLNWTGVIALGILAGEMLFSRDSLPGRKILLWICWGGMAVSQGLLFWLHPRMDALLDLELQGVVDYETFYPLHRLYLWASTVIWGFGFLWLLGWLTRSKMVCPEKFGRI